MKVQATRSVKVSNSYKEKEPRPLGTPPGVSSGLRSPCTCPLSAVSLQDRMDHGDWEDDFIVRLGTNAEILLQGPRLLRRREPKNHSSLDGRGKYLQLYFPRLKDEGVIFRMLVFWARLTSACLSFLMTKNNPVRAPVVASLTSSLRDLEKFNYLDMFALVSFQETNHA